MFAEIHLNPIIRDESL